MTPPLWQKAKVKVKEESEKVGLKLSIQKTKTMASSPITLWQIQKKKVETVIDFLFLGSNITAVSDCFQLSPFYLPWSDRTRCHDLSFLNVEFYMLSQLFHSPLSPSSRGSLAPLCFLPLEWHHLHICGGGFSPGNLDSGL